MHFTDELADHIKLNRHIIVPLARDLYRCGFSGHFIRGGEILDMKPYVDAGDPAPMHKILADHTGPENGFEIRLNGKAVTRTTYEQDGASKIELVFLKGPAREFLKEMPAFLAQLREVLFENFELSNLTDLIDFGADFLRKTKTRFRYTIHAFGSPIFDGRLHGDVLRVGILDPPAYLRMGLFFLKGADAVALSIRNPLDILGVIDTAQAALRHLALAYEEREMRIEVSALGQKLLTCGAGVRSNLMTSRFGPTSLHLDVIFKILSSALAWTTGR